MSSSIPLLPYVVQCCLGSFVKEKVLFFFILVFETLVGKRHVLREFVGLCIKGKKGGVGVGSTDNNIKSLSLGMLREIKSVGFSMK